MLVYLALQSLRWTATNMGSQNLKTPPATAPSFAAAKSPAQSPQNLQTQPGPLTPSDVGCGKTACFSCHQLLLPQCVWTTFLDLEEGIVQHLPG